MKPIRQLSASIVNKIAAGEVIERPASVVKELLENSVDAGATRIELSLENGGNDLIKISDNGCGIPQDQLQLAVTPHATSKIEDADDLFQVGTFGFRGEALASITEISQATIRSRPATQECGFELVINGGHREEEQPCGCPTGTTIEIRQLFYNTPVRAKFLKSPQTEKGHIIEAFTRIALAHPEIQLTLLHNEKPVYQLAPTTNWRERIDAFFGPEISDSLIPVANDDPDIKIHGFVVDPSVSRANNRMQYLFLNRRYIRDRSLQHALTEAYRGLLMTGRFPVCFLRMEMSFALVDVNVHPAKLEVRFQNGGQVYSQLLSTIRNRFLTTDLTAYAQLSKRPVQEFRPFGESALGHLGGTVEAGSAVANSNDTFQLAPTDEASHQTRLEFPATPARDWTNSPFGQTQSIPSDFSGRDRFSNGPVGFSSSPGSGSLSSSTHGDSFPAVHRMSADPSSSDRFGNEDFRGLDQGPFERRDFSHASHSSTSRKLPAMQVHNTYIVQETDEGMVVIDQHALHERILYEQLKTKFQNGKLESQRLLVPEPVSLPSAESAAILQEAELLGQLGIQVEPFGGDTVLITAYPAMLANQNPAEILGGVVDKLMGENKNLGQEDLIDELLHMISCKAAIKAGDKLTSDEITALLEHRENCQDAHHCPHGRPTSLVFSREELDRRFKRI